MDPLCYLCFVFVCHTVLSVSCSLVVTCCERAGLLAFLYVFLCFVTFPYGVLCQMWCLIVSIPGICLLPYFYCISEGSRLRRRDPQPEHITIFCDFSRESSEMMIK